MQSKEEILIETLHGSIEQLKSIPQQIEGVSVYLSSGHVDLKFFTECLQCVTALMDASNTVVTTLSSLLGPISEPSKEMAKSDEGKKWNVEDILKHSTLTDNVLRLPQVQFNRKSYAEAKKWIEEAGGKWEGGKVQGFTFPFNANRVYSILKEGKRCRLQQEYQYFSTPPDLADWLVAHCTISLDDKILEPSAGTGAIIDAIHRACPECNVDCFELMPENQEILLRKEGVNLLGENFLESQVSGYTRIFANPPFSKNQDIDHVMEMYSRLAKDGMLVAIMSQHWMYGSEKKCVDFRSFLNTQTYFMETISEGAFRESGTGVATTCVRIIKK